MGGGGLGGIVSGVLSPATSIVGGVKSALGLTPNQFNAQGVPIDAPTTDQMAIDQYGNANQAVGQQRQFVDALAAQNGIANQNAAFQNASNLANGVGPNPALAQLNQSTAANTANQAALMAGQRGSSQNVGLMARQAGMQGAMNQQNAAGQAATLQAQQQLAGQQQMAALANQQVSQQQQGISQLGSQAQNLYGQVSGNISNQNNSAIGQNAGINSVNSGVAAGNQNANNQFVGNLTGAAGAALQTKAEGGMIEKYAEGGSVGPQSYIGKHFAGVSQQPRMMAEGGAVPALVSPGEKYLDPGAVKKVEKGADPMSVGKQIPGKPKVGGAKNSYANDTVPATLEEGGIVLPRSVTQAKDAPKKAAEFVAQVLKKQALKKG